MATVKCATGSEAACDTLQALINTVLGFPKKGSHLGGGAHCAMPEAWDGTGTCPPGWTQHFAANFVQSPAVSALPISDALAAQITAGIGVLSASNQTLVSAALAARTQIDLDAGIYAAKIPTMAVIG